jgi:hypothetical protein
MAIAKLERMPEFDLGQKTVPWKTRRAAGKVLRDEVPRESHAEWRPPKNRPDPVATVLGQQYWQTGAPYSAPYGPHGRCAVRVSARIRLCHGG